MEAQIGGLLGDQAVTVIVLDLTALRFMDSTGLRSILRADAVVRAAGRKLALVDGPEPVRRVFDITGMRRLLRFVSSPGAAAQEAA